MSVLTKKRPIEVAEIVIDGPHPVRYVGPKKKIKLVRELLAELNFMPEDATPWREVAKVDIERHGEAALMLRGAREREDLTQDELAKILGTDQGNIANMENGKRAIGKTMAKKLAEALKVDYRIFL